MLRLATDSSADSSAAVLPGYLWTRFRSLRRWCWVTASMRLN